MGGTNAVNRVGELFDSGLPPWREDLEALKQTLRGQLIQEIEWASQATRDHVSEQLGELIDRAVKQVLKPLEVKLASLEVSIAALPAVVQATLAAIPDVTVLVPARKVSKRITYDEQGRPLTIVEEEVRDTSSSV